MPTNRRSRRKSIAGNITDVQKRLRFLETRPAPSKLASKAVVTKNIALRAIETELIADASITTRTIGESQVTNFSLSTVTDPDGPAVDTENIAPLAVENGQLAGNITDDKISGMSSSKLIGQVQDSQIAGMSSSKLIGQVQDSQIAGLSTSKLIGTITNAQLAGSITEDKIVSLPTTKLTGTITNAQLAGSITNDKISTVDASKITTGTLDAARIPNLDAAKVTTGSFAVARIPNLDAAKVTSGTFDAARIPTLDPSKITGATNLLTTATVSGTGISRTFSTSGSYRSLDITISTGTGSNQLAVGNHTHTTVPAHTHVLTMNPINTSGTGAHGHTLVDGSHSHGFTPTGTVGAVQGSTIRIKKDVSNYALNDPKNILNLKMKRYKYKNSQRGYHDATNREWMYGYIAEDLQELGVEEVLSYDKDGLPDGINYGLISILTLELIKVQQAETDELKEELKQLREKIKNA